MHNLKTPSSWGDISLEQYIEFNSFEKENYISFIVERLAIVCDIPTEDIEGIEFEKLNDILTPLSWLNGEPPISYKSDIDDLKFKGFTSLTLGEYIDIDTLLSEDVFNNMPLLFSIVYRKHRVNRWGNLELEPYEYDIKERSKVFLRMPISDLYGVFHEWTIFKGNILKTYATLLDEQITEEEIEEAEQEDKEEIKKEAELQKFSWQRVIYDLCSGDVSKFNDVVGLPFIYVMNTLSMKYAMKI